MRKHEIWNCEKNLLQDILDTSSSYKEICEKLNLQMSKSLIKMISYRVKVEKLDRTTFILNNKNFRNSNLFKYRFKEIPLTEILIENSMYVSTVALKNRLLNNGTLEYKCKICNINNWLGNPITLQLDHINGKNNDNRVENIRLLCPNCHSQTDTYSNKKRKKEIFKKLKKCVKCGCDVDNKVFCNDCDKEIKLKRRKVERPLYNDLINEIKNFGYSATGRKYGVSDVSIRKWEKNYEKEMSQ
jgi:5-methylcytosine-specific restriction endonuclease McrA